MTKAQITQWLFRAQKVREIYLLFFADQSFVLEHIVGLEPEFKNNDIFIDEQRCVSSLDDTLRWYNYCNFNICPRRNDVTSGTYIDNNFICMDKIFGYRIWCDKNGYDYL